MCSSDLADVGKLVDLGSGNQREIDDVFLFPSPAGEGGRREAPDGWGNFAPLGLMTALSPTFAPPPSASLRDPPLQGREKNLTVKFEINRTDLKPSNIPHFSTVQAIEAEFGRLIEELCA